MWLDFLCCVCLLVLELVNLEVQVMLVENGGCSVFSCLFWPGGDLNSIYAYLESITSVLNL